MRSSHLLVLSLVGVLLGGCDAFQRTVIETSAVEEYPSTDQDFEFWDALSKQSVVTNNDALHGFLLLANGTDSCETYECRYQAGVAAGWFEGTWGGMPEEDASAKVGWMAVAGCKILGIKGGLSMQLFGDSPRYCSRELTFMGLLPAVTENEALSGLEFTAFVDNIEDRQRFDAAIAAREQLKTLKKEQERAARAKRIAEVLTPLDPLPVEGSESLKSDDPVPPSSESPTTAKDEDSF